MGVLVGRVVRAPFEGDERVEQQLGCGRSLLGLSGEWTGWSDAAAVAAPQRRMNGAVPDEALGEEVLAVPGEGRGNVGKLIRVRDLE